MALRSSKPTARRPVPAGRQVSPFPRNSSAPANPHATELEVVADHFIWKSPDGEFAVLTAIDADDGSEVKLTGPVAYVNPGESLKLQGRWVSKPKYGFSFEVRRFETIRPNTINAIQAYLEENLYGVGPVGARKIVDHFGLETLDVLDATPERLHEVPGMGKAKVMEVMRHWEEAKATREVMLYLEQFPAITPRMGARIYKAWGEQAIPKLKKNPYVLTQLDRIGFRIADKVAKQMGVPLNDPHRIDAGIIYVLDKAESNGVSLEMGKNGKPVRATGGHCYLTLAELLFATGAELELQEASELIAERVRKLHDAGKLVMELSLHGERHVYSKRMHKAETRLATKLRTLADSAPYLKFPAHMTKPTTGAMVPTDEQWQAIETALHSRISVLTGGPGTGKTSATRLLCDVLDHHGYKIMLCAPTGKAAKRASEATGHEARTIHRLLEWSPQINGFVRGPGNPIQADVLVVDECSMVDIPLADKLFQAIGDKTHVVLVGDVDQLPPVGPGKFLHDVINSKRVPITRLTQIFRQAAKSMIIQAAYAINSGKVPVDDPHQASQMAGFEVDQNYFWIPRALKMVTVDSETGEDKQVDDTRANNAAILDLTVDYACNRIPRRYGFDPVDDIQVMAPMSTTDVGVEALNRALQQQLNPHGDPIAECKRRGFRVGDKILNTKNDYNHDIMNGEFARITDYVASEQLVIMECEGREIQMGAADVDDHFVLAYAVTVHKMQGSSARAVVVPISKSFHNMLTRNLLYTAVTRAEQLCMVIGHPASLRVAVSTPDTAKRNTALSSRLLHPALSGQLV